MLTGYMLLNVDELPELLAEVRADHKPQSQAAPLPCCSTTPFADLLEAFLSHTALCTHQCFSCTALSVHISAQLLGQAQVCGTLCMRT